MRVTSLMGVAFGGYADADDYCELAERLEPQTDAGPPAGPLCPLSDCPDRCSSSGSAAAGVGRGKGVGGESGYSAS